MTHLAARILFSLFILLGASLIVSSTSRYGSIKESIANWFLDVLPWVIIVQMFIVIWTETFGG